MHDTIIADSIGKDRIGVGFVRKESFLFSIKISRWATGGGGRTDLPLKKNGGDVVVGAIE